MSIIVGLIGVLLIVLAFNLPNSISLREPNAAIVPSKEAGSISGTLESRPSWVLFKHLDGTYTFNLKDKNGNELGSSNRGTIQEAVAMAIQDQYERAEKWKPSITNPYTGE